MALPHARSPRSSSTTRRLEPRMRSTRLECDCPDNQMQKDDVVRVFSISDATWVNAEITEHIEKSNCNVCHLPRPDVVRVEYRDHRSQHCRKNLHVNSEHLCVLEEAVEQDPGVPKPRMEPRAQPRQKQQAPENFADILAEEAYFAETLARSPKAGPGLSSKKCRQLARELTETALEQLGNVDGPHVPWLEGTEMLGGVRYFGELSDGIPHGHGRMLWPDGREFFGVFAHGKRCSGTMIWSNGRSYAGQWRNNLPHGEGTCTSKDGETWRGWWVKGEPLAEEEDGSIAL